MLSRTVELNSRLEAVITGEYSWQLITALAHSRKATCNMITPSQYLQAMTHQKETNQIARC